MDILKVGIRAEFNKQVAEYAQQICDRDIKNMELKLKLDQNLLTKTKAKPKRYLENKHCYKQTLLLDKYAKQIEVLKIRSRLEITVKEAVHNDNTH